MSPKSSNAFKSILRQTAHHLIITGLRNCEGLWGADMTIVQVSITPRSLYLVCIMSLYRIALHYQSSFLFPHSDFLESAHTVGFNWRDLQGNREADRWRQSGGHGHQAATGHPSTYMEPSVPVRFEGRGGIHQLGGGLPFEPSDPRCRQPSLSHQPSPL